MHYCLILSFIFVPYLWAYSRDPDYPNVLFFFGDDWGWNDIQYNGGNEMITPNLNKYANVEGIRLNKHYSQYVCTPARAALLTGRYPASIGMQHGILVSDSIWGLPTKLTLLSQMLKKESYGNYNTYMLGKWHLGFVTKKYLPENRGFDSFIGYYNGMESYTSKNYHESDTDFSGTDFHRDSDPENDTTYSTTLYTDEVKKIIKSEIDGDNPFFIYAAYQAIHSPNEMTSDVESEIDLSLFKHVSPDRQIKVLQAYLFDQSFGQIVRLLQSEGVWENTLVVFASDNGGELTYDHSNYPLRGDKNTLYEGGIRTPAFITGGIINENNKGKIYNSLFHVTDWFPTILNLISNNDKSDINKLNLDGIDQSNIIKSEFDETTSNRNEILINYYSSGCSNDYACGGIIYNNYKLIIGDHASGTLEYKSGWIKLKNQKSMLPSTINCNGKEPKWSVNYNIAPWNGKGLLFNLDEDPCEYNDLSTSEPKIYKELLTKLQKYKSKEAESLDYKYNNVDISSVQYLNNPDYHNGFWTAWLTHKQQQELINQEDSISRTDRIPVSRTDKVDGESPQRPEQAKIDEQKKEQQQINNFKKNFKHTHLLNTNKLALNNNNKFHVNMKWNVLYFLIMIILLFGGTVAMFLYKCDKKNQEYKQRSNQPNQFTTQYQSIN